MKKVFLLITFFIITLSMFLYLGYSYAQDNFRGRTRERIRERLKEHAQTYGFGDYEFSLVHEGITRKYNVHLPQSYNEKVPAPVVIYLHGGGGTIKSAYKEGLDKYSDKFGFILVIPAGTGTIPDYFLTWNAGKWDGGQCCGYAIHSNIDDLGFISKMIDEIKNKFNIDDKRIYATGISNGAMMSYRLACELSDKIAAIAPVAPPAIPDNCMPSRPISIMHIHGTADPCARYNGGPGGGCLLKTEPIFVGQSAKQMVDYWIKKNTCSTNFTTTYQKGNATCITYGQCKDTAEVEFCKIEGGGHTWPSGAQYLPVERIGPVSYDISFDQIWDFFQKH